MLFFFLLQHQQDQMQLICLALVRQCLKCWYIQSTLSEADILRNWQKCPLVELSTKRIILISGHQRKIVCTITCLLMVNYNVDFCFFCSVKCYFFISSSVRFYCQQLICKHFSILYQGPQIWNSPPVSVAGSSNVLSFKRKIQESLLIK